MINFQIYLKKKHAIEGNISKLSDIWGLRFLSPSVIKNVSLTSFFFLYFVIYVSLSHLLHSHCLVSSRTMLFFWVRDESWLHDKTSWWLWRRLARRFKSQRTVTEVLKMPLKVQGFSFSQCWPTKKIFFFPFLFQITFTVIIIDLFHVHILHSDCSRIQQTECSKKDYLYEYQWQLPFWLNFFQKLKIFFLWAIRQEFAKPLL